MSQPIDEPDVHRHPDSPWHRAWKAALAIDWAATTEVTVTRQRTTHRADAILPSGLVVELQQGYLDATSIQAREDFWTANGQRIIWVYDASRFDDRLHWGPRGFWWKNGARSMLVHRHPVWWHFGRAEPRFRRCDTHFAYLSPARCPNCEDGYITVPVPADRHKLDHHNVRIRLSAVRTDHGATRLLGTINARRHVNDWFPSFSAP